MASLLGTALWIGGIRRLPRRFAWRITADSEGPWFTGLRGSQHIAWDDLRKVECVANLSSGPGADRRYSLAPARTRLNAIESQQFQTPTSGRRPRSPVALAVVLAVAWTAAVVFRP
ncbi:hypothetical protein ACIF83_39440 [Streptomyces sp. NPDC085866]|uniref:hypothetical protein n=1 Tax=Streptomyces sp. NPDC085866 TaxID=3365736 RepID=UPI0037D2CEE7